MEILCEVGKGGSLVGKFMIHNIIGHILTFNKCVDDPPTPILPVLPFILKIRKIPDTKTKAEHKT